MQPTYLPWLGYFDLIDQVDVFVFLDDVQFVKRSWQQRNRIKTPDGLGWLTVPVHVRGRYHQSIRDVEIQSESRFPHGHLKTVHHNYARAAHYASLAGSFESALLEASATLKLVDLNVTMIRWMAAQFGVGAEFVMSSALGAEGVRSDLLVDICKKLGARTYLSPPGSSAYLVEEAERFGNSGIELMVHGYGHPSYHQMYPPFVPFASAVDLLFNLGPDSGTCLRSGRTEQRSFVAR